MSCVCAEPRRQQRNNQTTAADDSDDLVLSQLNQTRQHVETMIQQLRDNVTYLSAQVPYVIHSFLTGATNQCFVLQLHRLNLVVVTLQRYSGSNYRKFAPPMQGPIPPGVSTVQAILTRNFQSLQKIYLKLFFFGGGVPSNIQARQTSIHIKSVIPYNEVAGDKISAMSNFTAMRDLQNGVDVRPCLHTVTQIKRPALHFCL